MENRKALRLDVRPDHERGPSHGDVNVGLFNEWTSALTHWDIWGVCVCVSQSEGGQESSPCSPTGTWQSPQTNISWHFPWQLDVIPALTLSAGEQVSVNKVAQTIFSPPDDLHLSDACQCVYTCVCLRIGHFKNYFWSDIKGLNSTLNVFCK